MKNVSHTFINRIPYHCSTFYTLKKKKKVRVKAFNTNICIPNITNGYYFFNNILLSV